ncbi:MULTISPECIES: ferredoxin--NADP reductase [unclassified Mycolicibacterium]|uniref:ferredoxin--NADP reductase n=1 Tax=unclassified Mycolicibacterium TaxID=2636767 RepID=UPI0031B61123|nr:hypothetical protein [Mycolicibacterium sp. CBMA 213]
MSPTTGPLARTLLVKWVVDETPDAKSIALQVPPDDFAWRSYQPGQYLTVQIPSDREGSVARCYSLSSSPFDDEELVITVKRTAGGYGSNWLCDNAVVGSELTVLPPIGRFTPRSFDDDLTLFAGGSGITPVYSILRAALRNGNCRVTLFYANRDPQSVIFDNELRRLAGEFPDRLSLTHWLESEHGVPSTEGVATWAQGRGCDNVFICGPAAFMDCVGRALESVGMDHSQIHKEVYLSLSSNPFAPPESSEEQPPVIDDADGVPTAVVLDGTVHELKWPRGATLIDQMLARDVPVPYMCRDGECGSCQATVEQGQVDMLRNYILDDDDVADGYVLTCQAVPAGDDPIRIVF